MKTPVKDKEIKAFSKFEGKFECAKLVSKGGHAHLTTIVLFSIPSSYM